MTSRSPWSGLAAARPSGTSSPPPTGTPEETPLMRSRLDSGSVQVAVAAAAALVLRAAASLGAGSGILSQATSACQAQPPASTAAAAIPAAYLADYEKAG